MVGRSTHDHCMECCVLDGCNKETCEVKHFSGKVTFCLLLPNKSYYCSFYFLYNDKKETNSVFMI